MRATKEITEAVARLTAEGRITEHGTKAPLPEMTEKEFLAAFRELAKRCGWLCYHTHDSRKSEPGFLDALCLRAGRLVVAELKVPPNGLTPDQETWLEEWRKVPSAEVHVFTPADWNTVEEVLA